MSGKTSKSTTVTIRLNPIEKNPSEIKACEVLADYDGQGFNAKRTIVAALCQMGGMSADDVRAYNNMPRVEVDSSGLIQSIETLFSGRIESLLQDFAEKLLSSGAVGQVHTPQAQQAVSAFARNFAQGLRERQEDASGDFEAEE